MPALDETDRKMISAGDMLGSNLGSRTIRYIDLLENIISHVGIYHPEALPPFTPEERTRGGKFKPDTKEPFHGS